MVSRLRVLFLYLHSSRTYDYINFEKCARIKLSQLWKCTFIWNDWNCHKELHFTCNKVPKSASGDWKDWFQLPIKCLVVTKRSHIHICLNMCDLFVITRHICWSYVKEMAKILNVTLTRSLSKQVLSAP